MLGEGAGAVTRLLVSGFVPKYTVRAIDAIVGNFCHRRSPAGDADVYLAVYEIAGHGVTVFEEQPDWSDLSIFRRCPVATFVFVRPRDEWTLWWMDNELGCFQYPVAATDDLGSLVAVVEEDEHGAFFG